MVPTTTATPTTTENVTDKESRVSVVTPSKIMAIPLNSYANESPVLKERSSTQKYIDLSSTSTEKGQDEDEEDDNET